MQTREAIEIYQALVGLRDSRSDALPFQIAYAITRNIKMLEPVIKDFDEVRQKIFLAYGAEENGEIVVPQDKIKEANNEITELLDMENPIELVKVKASSLESLNFSLKDLEAIYPIILGEE